MWDLELSGKSILVTGGSSGIGKAVAVQAAREGARVAIIARDQRRLDGVLAALPGSKHFGASFDLSRTEILDELADKVRENFGQLDGIVHAAGIYRVLPVRTTSSSSIKEIFDVNFFAPLLLTKLLVRKTQRAEKLSVVFLSSVASLKGQPGASSYSASKGAINSMVPALVAELSRDGIRFNNVVAGLVDTELSKEMRRTIGELAWNSLVDQHPLGLGDANEVANAVMFLLSGKSKWITGSQLVVDGGYLSC